MKNYLQLNNYQLLFERFLTALTLLSFYGAVVYYFYALNWLGLSISLILAIITYIILTHIAQKNNAAPVALTAAPETTIQGNNYLILAIYLVLLFINFYFLARGATSAAIISPWQILPWQFFLGYFLSSLTLLYALSKGIKLSLLLTIFHFFLSFSVAWLIYKIGFGFDPFIHRASLDLIDKQGFILPKTPYYLGQYSLIIIFHKLFFLPLVWLDKLLVPLLAAVSLPLALIKFTNKWFGQNRERFLLPTSLLLLPYAFFTFTVPQNFAYLFLAIMILLGLSMEKRADLLLVYLLALAALVTHPLVGLPGIIFALVLSLSFLSKNKRYRRLYYLFFVVAALALPLAFYLLEKQLAGGVSETIFSQNNFVWPKIVVPGEENFILNFAYLYGFNLKIVYALLLATGLYLAYKERARFAYLFNSLFIAAALLIAYFLIKLLPFSFLINYERNDYPARILLLVAFFLFPFIPVALNGFSRRLQKQNKLVKIFFLLFFAASLTLSLYFSYPRQDRFYNSRGLSVGQADIEVSRWIEENKTADYIVLANQQVSAAALSQFGFNRYYKDNIFYYPIPTGGPLYQYYLKMVYQKPARQTVEAAMALAGVDEAYFVLNKYWWAFPRVLAEAKLEAGYWKTFSDGQVYVFVYKK